MSKEKQNTPTNTPTNTDLHQPCKSVQVDEMARIIDDNHGFIVSSVETAKALYNAGYRKHSEWISVEDRLPKEYGDYLVAVKINKLWETKGEHGVSVACFVISEIPNVNGWHIEIEDGYQYEITHWMPLPEAPKMKGGAK